MALTIVTFFISYALIPQIVKNYREKDDNVSLQTSTITALGVYVICAIYFTLNLFLASIIAFASAIFWTIITIQGIIYKRRKRQLKRK